MTESILDSVKKTLGLASDYTAFDPDVIMHINTVFVIFNGLGLGPTAGFQITDNTTTWDAYTSTNLNLNAVKSDMYLRVKMMFDPPATSFVIDATNKISQELEWRLNVDREGVSWTDPNPPQPPPVPPWWEIF